MIGVSMFLIVLAAGLVQDLVPTAFLAGGVKLPLLFAVTLYYALRHTFTIALVAAILAGVFQDSLSLVPLGYSSFLFGVFVLVFQRLRESLHGRLWQVAAVSGAVGYGIFIVLMQLLLTVTTEYITGPTWFFWMRVGTASLLGAVITPLVWMAARHLDEVLGNEPVRGA